jgi:hypothetical protein
MKTKGAFFLDGNLQHPAGWFYRIPGSKRQGPFAFQHQALASRASDEKGTTRKKATVRGNPCELCGYDHDRQPERAERWHIEDEAQGMLEHEEG